MYKLTINHDGDIFCGNELISPDVILSCLRYEIILNPDYKQVFSLNHLRNVLIKYPDIIKLHPNLDDILNFNDDVGETTFDNLVLSYNAYMVYSCRKAYNYSYVPADDGGCYMIPDYEEKENIQDNIFWSLSGVSDSDAVEYSLSLTPLCEIFNVNIKLGNSYQSVTIEDRDSVGELVKTHRKVTSPLKGITFESFLTAIHDSVVMIDDDQKYKEADIIEPRLAEMDKNDTN